MRTKFALIIFLLGTLILPPPLQCGTLDYGLSVGIGEEYNDNVNEQANGKTDWVTKPTVHGSVQYLGPRVEGSISVDGSYNIYLLGNRQNEFKGGGQAKGKVEAVKDLVFIEGEDKLSQVYANITKGETNETDSNRQLVFQNESTARIYVTPSISDRLGLKAGYEFKLWLYDQNQPGSNRNSDYSTYGQNKWNHKLFAGATYDLTPTIVLSLDAEGTRQEPTQSGYNRTLVNAGVRWQYMEDGVLSVKAGPRVTFYDNGETKANPFWEGKLTHAFGRLTFTAETSSVFEENPTNRYDSLRISAGGTVAWSFDRGSLQARGRYSYLTGQDTEDTRQLSLGISGTYELTPRLVLRASGNREYSLTTNRTLTRWYAYGSLQYELTQGFSVEGYYRWKLSESTRTWKDNYFVNIVGLQVRKTF